MRKGLVSLALFLVGVAIPAAQTAYYPPPGQWARKAPAEVGMDPARLNDAVEFMKMHETASPARDFSDQEIVNGKLLASMPTERAATNGLIIRRGYIVAEFGDTLRPDPTYSVAKEHVVDRCRDRCRSWSDPEPGPACRESRERWRV